MENNPDNPKAFPREGISQYGMELRDYFAAKAMQGLMSMEDKGVHGTLEECYQKIAEHSYRVADAMLKQREQ